MEKEGGLYEAGISSSCSKKEITKDSKDENLIDLETLDDKLTIGEKNDNGGKYIMSIDEIMNKNFSDFQEKESFNKRVTTKQPSKKLTPIIENRQDFENSKNEVHPRKPDYVMGIFENTFQSCIENSSIFENFMESMSLNNTYFNKKNKGKQSARGVHSNDYGRGPAKNN